MFKVGNPVIVQTDKWTKHGKIVKEFPAGEYLIEEDVQKYYKIKPGEKFYTAICNGVSKFPKYAVEFEGESYFVFPANPDAFKYGILYGRGFFVQKEIDYV